ncbi:MAG TPA: hypothetical protein QF651_03515, partial [Acidimicrobiales bacterium]|nr:hypothetical protein [Acidimicrobiales bacterium]
MNDGVSGPLALQRRIPVEIDFADPGIAPYLFIGVWTLDVVEAFEGGATKIGKPVRSGETTRDIGRKGVQGGTSEPVQTTDSPFGSRSGGGVSQAEGSVKLANGRLLGIYPIVVGVIPDRRSALDQMRQV